MILKEIINSKAIALNTSTNLSGRPPYLALGWFPNRKKAGLHLSWIRTSKGLPITLAPSTYDAKATLRSRDGFTLSETQMPFFREGRLVKEQDVIDIINATNGQDPLLAQALDSLYDDANDLIEGAEVVPERMRWSLLTAPNGKPSISIVANNVTYAYDYDPDGTWQTGNYTDLTTPADKWNVPATATPLDDVKDAQDAVEDRTGTRPTIMVVSRATMNNLLLNAQVRNAILAQNVTANIYMTDTIVRNVFRDLLGIEIIVYTKKYRDEQGQTQQFLPDGVAVLIPEGTLGNTYYGQTPEEIVAPQAKDFDVTLYDGRIAVAVQHTLDPVHAKIIASEVVLPSYERMDEVAVIKAY